MTFPVRAITLGMVLFASAGCAATIDPAAIEDAQTAVRVRSALLNDPEIGDRMIVVAVADGIVQLTGFVGSQEESDRAAALARAAAAGHEVRVLLRIGGQTPASQVSDLLPPESSVGEELEEPQEDSRLLALGASVGWSAPRLGTLGERVSFGPLVRLGSGRGFGPAFALNWFQTDIDPTSARPGVESRIHVRPLMFGAGYTFASEQVSISPSLVAGIAFNSLSVTETGVADRVAVEVGNAFAWRPGVSIWLDVSRRVAVNLSAGYIVTRFRVTYLENGRLERRRVDGDTTILHAGLAYKVF